MSEREQHRGHVVFEDSPTAFEVLVQRELEDSEHIDTEWSEDGLGFEYLEILEVDTQ